MALYLMMCAKKDRGGGMMERLTERDEFGNADIIGVDSEDLQLNLDFEQMNKVTDSLNKLAQYEDLDEQSLLLRLPVPIGTTVYKFDTLAKGAKRYIKTTITRYEVFDDSIWFTFANGLGRNIKDFGKFVFLTQEEAEKRKEEGDDRI